jgi:hypothetical protein
MAQLVAADLLAPKGLVEGSSFFPGLSATDLSARLSEYLKQAYAKAGADGVAAENLDEAARQYAYYRVAKAVHLRLVSNPSSVSTSDAGGSVSASFTQQQIQTFADMANDALLAYQALLPVVEGGATAIPGGTQFVPNVPVW